jgi:hypothetical protein
MFEKKLTEISGKFGKDGNGGEYYIIENKKHRREIYFRNTRSAVNFMKKKFNSPKKKIAYFMIKTGLLQPFLRKIMLSKTMGDVIFVAEQIKCFNLEKKTAYSFIKEEKDRKNFIESKKFQIKAAKKDFAPEITVLDEKMPFCEEELLEEFQGKNLEKPFAKLYSFYEKTGIKKIPAGRYAIHLSGELQRKKISDDMISSVLGRAAEMKETLLVAIAHGDFAKEQILEKNSSYVFIDWKPCEAPIIRDLANFFMTEEALEKINVEKNPRFLGLLKIYPDDVRKNLGLYLILNEVLSIIKGGNMDLSKKRLGRFIALFPFFDHQAAKIKKLAD